MNRQDYTVYAKAKLIDLINLKVLGIVDVTKTSDGFYLGMKPGDIGFNAFIGKPAPLHEGPGLDRTLKIWDEMTPDERTAVSAAARARGISLTREFGIPMFQVI